ncbi:MAG: carboxypeptidase regulatory-like domain-containing protein [bacterium]
MCRKTIVILSLVIGLLLLTASLVAQPIRVDFVLSAKVVEGGKVYLSWTKPFHDTVAYYLVYRLQQPAYMSSLGKFTQIDSTKLNESTDQPPLIPDKTLAIYQVIAKITNGTTRYSTTAGVDLADKVTITSKPPTTVSIGGNYSYQVTATSSDPGATLKYYLAYKPEGMTIDTLKGLVTWSPATQGYFRVGIGARSNKGGRTEQSYVITVSGPTGTVSGVISDTTGKPIAKVTVRLYKRSTIRSFEYTAWSDELGKYSISQVDTGTYIAQAVPMRGDYLEQWYNGVSSSDKATPISVRENSTSVINFTLKSKVLIPFYTVKGTVLDTLKKPIKDAVVVFSYSGFSLNGARGVSDIGLMMDPKDMFDLSNSLMCQFGSTGSGFSNGFGTNDFRLDGNSEFVFMVKTDLNGAYSIKLPQGSYTIMSYAAGHNKLFYNNKTDLLTADVLRLSKDTSSINFVLKPLSPLAVGKISGQVVDSLNKSGVAARIIAFRMRSSILKDTLNAPAAYHADTDSLGKYTVENLAPGDYIIFAMPLGRFVPSFYSIKGPTIRWDEATKVSVNGNSITGINIIVTPMGSVRRGYTSINGFIKSSVLPGGLRKGTSTYPIAGAVVYAIDDTKEVVGYGITDTDGAFTISELSPATYSVVVDKVEYSSQSTSASPSYSLLSTASPANITLDISPVAVTDVEEIAPIPTGYILEQNYPNPFNPSTQILFSLPESQVASVVVYNLIGQKVATLLDGYLTAGTHAVVWNGRDSRGKSLSSGIYFYQLTAGSYTSVKKMALMK